MTKLLLLLLICLFSKVSISQKNNQTIIQIAKIEIKPNELENYKKFLKEGIKMALIKEKGVLKLIAVYDKFQPHKVTVFEVYKDSNAYKSHLQTAHFKKYKIATKDMISTLELIPQLPIFIQ